MKTKAEEDLVLSFVENFAQYTTGPGAAVSSGWTTAFSIVISHVQAEQRIEPVSRAHLK